MLTSSSSTPFHISRIAMTHSLHSCFRWAATATNEQLCTQHHHRRLPHIRKTSKKHWKPLQGRHCTSCMLSHHKALLATLHSSWALATSSCNGTTGSPSLKSMLCCLRSPLTHVCILFITVVKVHVCMLHAVRHVDASNRVGAMLTAHPSLQLSQWAERFYASALLHYATQLQEPEDEADVMHDVRNHHNCACCSLWLARQIV